MSSAGPQQPELNPGTGSRSSGRGLRSLPGFTTAAVVFVLIVLLGIGGVAIANWNQTATVAIAITAGAAATTSPPPTTAPPATPPTTAPPTVPPVGPGNIVAAPVVAPRPQLMNSGSITCAYLSTQSDLSGEKYVDFRFSWPASGNATSYVTSLNSDSAGFVYRESKTVSGTQVDFTLERKNEARVNYVLRIQPMIGNVAGDPIYRTMQHNAQLKANCFDASPTAVSPAGRSPLGAFSVNAGPAKQEVVTNANLSPNANQVKLSFVGATEATDYVVSVQSTTTASSYGAEYRATAPGTTLTFPLRAFQNGQPAAPAAFYGQYTVRVIPMKGSVAGDPVYKIVQYGQWSTEVWDWAIGWG